MKWIGGRCCVSIEFRIIMKSISYTNICSGKLVLYNNYQIEKEDFWKSSFLMNYLYKNAGFIILLTSIFILFYFGEIRILIIFIRLMDYNNSFSIIFLLFIFLLFLY